MRVNIYETGGGRSLPRTCLCRQSSPKVVGFGGIWRDLAGSRTAFTGTSHRPVFTVKAVSITVDRQPASRPFGAVSPAPRQRSRARRCPARSLPHEPDDFGVPIELPGAPSGACSGLLFPTLDGLSDGGHRIGRQSLLAGGILGGVGHFVQDPAPLMMYRGRRLHPTSSYNWRRPWSPRWPEADRDRYPGRV